MMWRLFGMAIVLGESELVGRGWRFGEPLDRAARARQAKAAVQPRVVEVIHPVRRHALYEGNCFNTFIISHTYLLFT